MGCGSGHPARVGCHMGRHVCDDVDQPMAVGNPAPQVHRAGPGGAERACTNLNPDGTRRRIAALLGAPILLEEAQAAGVKPAPRAAAPTPACDAMRAVGQWNVAWDRSSRWTRCAPTSSLRL